MVISTKEKGVKIPETAKIDKKNAIWFNINYRKVQGNLIRLGFYIGWNSKPNRMLNYPFVVIHVGKVIIDIG